MSRPKEFCPTQRTAWAWYLSLSAYTKHDAKMKRRTAGAQLNMRERNLGAKHLSPERILLYCLM